MKKPGIAAVCGLLACSMLFGACGKEVKNETTTTQGALSTRESTTLESTSPSMLSASTTKKPATSKKVTTTKKKTSSSAKSSGSSKKPGNSNTPNVDIPHINTDHLDPNFKTTSFETLSSLKKIAKDNHNKDGMDMFRDGKIVYAPFSLNGNELYGEVTKDYLDTYCSFSDEEDSSKGCDVLYRAIMQRAPSHKLSDLLGSQAQLYTQISFEGKSYYYQTAEIDGEYAVVVLSFAGNYLCMAAFGGNINPEEYGIEYFLDISNFTSTNV